MKILVVQIGKIGDMVLTTPLFREIHRHFPGARVNALVSRRGAPVIRGNPNISKILVYRKDPLSLLFLLLKLRLTRYDFLIDPKDHFSTESALLARMSGANISIGFNKRGNKVFSRPLPAQEENYTMHAAARNLLPLTLMGISNSLSDRPELFPDPILQAGIRERSAVCNGKTILLNISTGDACRLWEEKKWCEVAEFCLKKGFHVLLSFQPKDAAMAGNIQKQQPAALLFHSASIRDVIALVPLVSLVVTPDTSIVHIASAFNIPQVALFPPVEWNLNKFRPLSDSSVVLQPKDGEAIAAIRAEDVIRAVETIMHQKS
jgi:heptosyltransferase III